MTTEFTKGPRLTSSQTAEHEFVNCEAGPLCELAQSVRRKARESAAVQEELVRTHADALVACAVAVAARLAAGGKLLVLGNGGSACDAAHVAVEFMHPVVEKRPAYAAIALSNDSALLTAVGNDRDFSLAFASQLRLLASAKDVVLGISTSGESANVNRALQAAREIGALVIGFTGRDGGRMRALCDHAFVAPSFSIHRIQECHVLLLHLLWDLVHLARGEEDVL